MYKHSKKRKAVFFTLFYPYTHSGVSYDPYVSSEVKRLAEDFDTIEVISLSIGHNGQTETPINVHVSNLHIELSVTDKIFSFLLLFKKYFRDELKSLKGQYSRSVDMALLKAITVYALRAEKYKVHLENLMAKINFDEYEVVVYSYWNFEYALAATLLKEKYPVKTVIRNHSLDLYFERMPENYQPFKRFIFSKSDLFVLISEQGMNYFIEKHQIPVSLQGKIFLNRVGIENTLPVYYKSIEKLVILTNAWIQPLKRIDLLIRSLALIEDISIEWIQIGDDYGTGRMPEIVVLAKKYLDGKPNVRYQFAGRKNMDEIYSIYEQRKVNLFINLSTTEGIPVSMMEALSFGVPIIGTRVGGVPEIVEDGVNGFLMPPEINEQQVAAKIIQYYKLSEDQKKELSVNARKVWEEKFNAEKNSALLAEKITSV